MKLYESKAPMEIMIFAFALKFMILPHFFFIICQPNILSCYWIMTGWWFYYDFTTIALYP